MTRGEDNEPVGSIWRNYDLHRLGSWWRIGLDAACDTDRVVVERLPNGMVLYLSFGALREALDFGQLGEWLVGEERS